jgi:N-acetylglucosamine malate deacetylase 1
MMHCHVSQFYEWIPWNQLKENEVPKTDRERRQWLKGQRVPADVNCANKYRKKLVELYGRKAGAKVKHAEAFEVCEYGSALTPALRKELFPFVK